MRKLIQLAVIVAVLGGIAFLLWNFDDTYTYVLAIGVQIIGYIIAVRLIFIDDRGTPSKIAWILIIVILPVVGTVFFMFFGRNPRSRIFTEHQIKEVKKLHAASIQMQTYYGEDDEEPPHLAKRIRNLSRMNAFQGNNIEVLTNGNEKFPRLIEELKQAKHNIHIQYYIYREDPLGTEIRDILVEKAKEGVEIRFLYDGWGSKLKPSFVHPIKQAGGFCYAYDPVLSPWIIRTANLRNHRKVVIIDGKIAYTGGLNVGDEYRSIIDMFKNWRDTHLRIVGPAVLELQTSFLSDWVYMENRKDASAPFISLTGIDKYFSPDDASGSEWAQVIWGGPYDKEKVVRDGMLDLIESSHKTVYITSPYFVPDDEALSVVRRAALSGIDVRVLIPGKGDAVLSFNGTNGYCRTLLEAGVRVFMYDQESFIHGKIIIVDDKAAAIGTANFDIRSFQLNHELMVFLYNGTPAVQKLVQDFKEDLKVSKEVTLEDLDAKKIPKKMLEALCKLFSPIL